MADRIVEVEWVDSAVAHGWQTNEDLPAAEAFRPKEIRSVGYVIADREDALVIAESWVIGPADGLSQIYSQFSCTTAIPRSAIRKVRELK